VSAAPLDGLRVIDFTRVLAGPHCTKALRDLGALVVKIEPPSGDLGRVSLPHVGDMGLYFVQQNAGKRNLSIDLNWAEAREIVVDLCRNADVIVENFRPGTLKRFGLAYEDVRAFNPKVVYASLSGYGQGTSWSNRPAFAPTVQAETGLTSIVQDHFGDALSELRGDACSHADVAMAATMLSVNERAGAQLSGIDTDGEPIALSANESHIFEMSDGRKLTIAGSPIYTPMFNRYCAMMRRNDLLADPRYATANLRRQNLASLLGEIRSWLTTFSDLNQLQAQVSEAGLAVGEVRTVSEFAESDWVKEWGAVVDVDDRAGSSTRMPGNPWRFSQSVLPTPGIPAFQGEHNEEILLENNVLPSRIKDLQERKVLLSRRNPVGSYD